MAGPPLPQMGDSAMEIPLCGRAELMHMPVRGQCDYPQFVWTNGAEGLRQSALGSRPGVGWVSAVMAAGTIRAREWDGTPEYEPARESETLEIPGLAEDPLGVPGGTARA